MTPQQAYNICSEENKRIKELEPVILNSSIYAYIYARNIIKDRWPEAECKILKDHYVSYLYALHVICNRWPEAECHIIIDSHYSCFHYARNVIKGRWLEAEPIIIKYEDYWLEYCRIFNINKNYNWKTGL